MVKHQARFCVFKKARPISFQRDKTSSKGGLVAQIEGDAGAYVKVA